MNSRNSDSRHTLFKKINILPRESIYIFPIIICSQD